MVKKKKNIITFVSILALTLTTILSSCSKDSNTDTKESISSELDLNQASPLKNTFSALDDKKSSDKKETSNEDTQDTTAQNSTSKATISEEESRKSPEMTSDEAMLYNEFISSYDISVLKNTNPVTIYKMFYKALTTDDYKTQYALYTKNGDNPAPADYDEFLNKLKEDPNYNSDLTAMIKSMNDEFSTLDVRYYDKDGVVLETENEMGWEISFGLIQTSDGVWKVRWYPVAT